MEDLRITKTKTAIKEAFISIIKDDNASKITVTEIAKQANINRKTFYLHYNSIEDLMSEFYQELADQLILILKENDFFDRSFDITSLFRSLNALINKDIEFYRNIVKGSFFLPFSEEVKNIIKSVALNSIATELNLSHNELVLYSEFYASGIASSYVLWLNNKLDLTEDEVAKIVGTAVFYGFQKLLP